VPTVPPIGMVVSRRGSGRQTDCAWRVVVVQIVIAQIATLQINDWTFVI